jgi:hypothetical protein
MTDVQKIIIATIVALIMVGTAKYFFYETQQEKERAFLFEEYRK